MTWRWRCGPQLRQARLEAASAEGFLAASFRAFFEFVAARRPETPVPETSRFRMDSPEVLAGFAELREDLDAAIAAGLLPAVDAGLLTAALAGVAFELGERVKHGGDVEETTRFATALFLGGLPALAPAVSLTSRPADRACRGTGSGPPCGGRWA